MDEHDRDLDRKPPTTGPCRQGDAIRIGAVVWSARRSGELELLINHDGQALSVPAPGSGFRLTCVEDVSALVASGCAVPVGEEDGWAANPAPFRSVVPVASVLPTMSPEDRARRCEELLCTVAALCATDGRLDPIAAYQTYLDLFERASAIVGDRRSIPASRRHFAALVGALLDDPSPPTRLELWRRLRAGAVQPVQTLH